MNTQQQTNKEIQTEWIVYQEDDNTIHQILYVKEKNTEEITDPDDIILELNNQPENLLITKDIKITYHSNIIHEKIPLIIYTNCVLDKNMFKYPLPVEQINEETCIWID